MVSLELRAGIIGGPWTPLAARQASVLVAHLTPRESAAVLDELGSMKPSVSSLDRLPKQLSGRWEEQREAFEEALRASSEVPAGGGDVGGVAPMLDGQRQAKRARVRRGARPRDRPGTGTSRIQALDQSPTRSYISWHPPLGSTPRSQSKTGHHERRRSLGAFFGLEGVG